MMIPAPRLLPATIITMAALLLLKCGLLVQALAIHGQRSDSVMVAAANAASTDQTREPDKPAAPPPAQKPATPAPQAAAGSGAPTAGATAAGAPTALGGGSAAANREGPPPVSDSERALLQDLRQRRQALDQEAAALKTRESVLVATEQKLSSRLSELQALQKKLEGLDSSQKQKEDAGWRGLAKMYEDMKPRDAATIMNDMSMPVLVQLMDRMKDNKAALVMAAMNPDRARDLTAQLAQLRTGRDTAGAPVAGTKPGPTGS